MTIQFLGTGTSQGVPVIGCDCPVCSSADVRDRRLRTSVWVSTPDTSLVIDSGPDFRYQMLRAGVRKLDAIVFTHGHKDHTAGLDDVRAYNYFQQKPMDVFASAETWENLHREFAYIFSHEGYPGIPQINSHVLDGRPFAVHGLELQPIEVLHFRMKVFGFRIQDFTYITDANYIAPAELKKLKGTRVLVLNALRREEHISHFSLSQAIDIAREVKAEAAYFTHISHQMGLHETTQRELPRGMYLAYDGLSLNL